MSSSRIHVFVHATSESLNISGKDSLSEERLPVLQGQQGAPSVGLFTTTYYTSRHKQSCSKESRQSSRRSWTPARYFYILFQQSFLPLEDNKI